MTCSKFKNNLINILQMAKRLGGCGGGGAEGGGDEIDQAGEKEREDETRGTVRCQSAGATRRPSAGCYNVRTASKVNVEGLGDDGLEPEAGELEHVA